MKPKHFNFLTYAIIGSTLLAAPFASQAAVIKATADWTLDGGSPASDVDGPATSGSVDILAGDDDGLGNSVFYHTYGNTAGNFGSRVSGDGNFDITGVFSFSNVYQNTSTSAQNAEFNFNVIPGELNVYFGGAMTGTDSLYADYSIDIMFNGTSIWDSSAFVSLDATNGYTFGDTGSHSLNGTYNGTGYYYWNNFSETLDLGSIAAGETFSIDYILSTTARGSFADVDCLSGGSDGQEFAFIDGQAVESEEGYGSSCGSAVARSGDPLNPHLPGNTAGVNFNQPTAVPEPSILMLFGLGFAGLFAASRKKQS